LKLLVWIVLAGCQTSYLVGRGDEALQRGEPDRAVADYLAALERRASSGSRSEIQDKIAHAALLLAEREIENAKTKDIETARARLWSILVADVWGADGARAAILGAIEELDRPKWEEIEALAADGKYVPALREANAVVTPYPEGHRVRARAADLAARAQEHHRKLAEESSDRSVSWFHHRAAIALGAEPRADLAELEREIEARAAYGSKVEIDDAKCPLLARLIREKLEKTEQVGPVAKIDFARCVEEDRTWSERETRRYTDRVPRVRFTEEPYWDEHRDPACDPEGCLRYDELGVCLERPPPPAKCLEPAEKTLAVRQVPVIEYENVEKELEIEVRRRRVAIETEGTIAYDGAEPVPFAAAETFEDSAFWSPRESRRFTGTDRSRVVESAFGKVKQVLDRRVAEVRAAKAIEASARADSESLHVLAVVVSRSVPAPVAEHFRSHYGMSETDVLAILDRASLFAAVSPPEKLELPPAELDLELDRFEHSSVARQEDVPGLALMTQTGVDLAFTGASTPLSTAELAFGFEATARVSNLMISGSGASTVLAGDVGGFALSLTGLAFDLEKVGFYFGWGLAYSQQSTDASERYRIFTIPLSIHVPIFSWVWIGASFEPNLLFAKTIFDDAEGDPHFWSPVRTWAVFDLYQRVFLEAGIAHHLGAGFDHKPVQAEFTIGVRL
jgi:hypothetical protein